MSPACGPSERQWGSPLRVVVADDHPFYRRSLSTRLRAGGIEVVREAPNGVAAILAVQETAPDVVVMDLNMPGISGLEATRRLTDAVPSARVLILTVSAQEADVAEAMLIGASGYVLKDGPVEEIIAGIRAAAAGESRISPRIAAVLLRRARETDDRAEHAAGPRLNSRELTMLELLAEGDTETEVAERLAIGDRAVREHISRILMKLQVDSRVRTAIRALRRRHRR